MDDSRTWFKPRAGQDLDEGQGTVLPSPEEYQRLPNEVKKDFVLYMESLTREWAEGSISKSSAKVWWPGDLLTRATVQTDVYESTVSRFLLAFPQDLRRAVDGKVHVTGATWVSEYLRQLLAPMPPPEDGDTYIPDDDTPIETLTILHGILYLMVISNLDVIPLLEATGAQRITGEELHDLMRTCPDMEDCPGPGAYGILFFDGAQWWWYIGETIDMRRRVGEHREGAVKQETELQRMMWAAHNCNHPDKVFMMKAIVYPRAEHHNLTRMMLRTLLCPIETVLLVGGQGGAWNPSPETNTCNYYTLTLHQSIYSRKSPEELINCCFAYLRALQDSARRFPHHDLLEWNTSAERDEHDPTCVEQWTTLFRPAMALSRDDEPDPIEYINSFFSLLRESALGRGHPLLRAILHRWPPEEDGFVRWRPRRPRVRQDARMTEAQEDAAMAALRPLADAPAEFVAAKDPRSDILHPTCTPDSPQCQQAFALSEEQLALRAHRFRTAHELAKQQFGPVCDRLGIRRNAVEPEIVIPMDYRQALNEVGRAHAQRQGAGHPDAHPEDGMPRGEDDENDRESEQGADDLSDVEL